LNNITLSLTDLRNKELLRDLTVEELQYITEYKINDKDKLISAVSGTNDVHDRLLNALCNRYFVKLSDYEGGTILGRSYSTVNLYNKGNKNFAGKIIKVCEPVITIQNHNPKYHEREADIFDILKLINIYKKIKYNQDATCDDYTECFHEYFFFLQLNRYLIMVDYIKGKTLERMMLDNHFDKNYKVIDMIRNVKNTFIST
jgi:hypothetical protein